MALADIVQVTISLQTASVAAANFGIPLVFTHHSVFAEDFRIYTTAAAMLTDGFTVDQGAHRIATAIFSQNPKVTQIIVGKRASTAVAMTHTLIPVIKDLTVYTVTINGTPFSFTSDETATDAEIVAGLISIINIGAEPVTASGTTTLILTADVAADTYRLQAARGLFAVSEDSADAGIAPDIAAFQLVNDDWYAMFLDKHSAPEIEAASATIETLFKIFIWSSMDDDALLAPTTDVFGVTAAANYTRSGGIWHSDPGNGPDAAWGGVLLPKDPGAATWKFKTLAGQVTDNLNPTEIGFLEGKNGNYYTEVAGVSITQQGTMAGGRFIDNTRSIDFTQARMQEAVFGQLAALDKIPFTDAGIAIVENEISGVLNANTTPTGDIFTNDPAPTVTVPLAKDVSSADKENRLLPDINFTATLAGAIHSVQVNGVVTV